MPFGLKNARATYQRLVTQMFSKQIRRNIEVYVDNMLMKRRKAELHLDLKETFRRFEEVSDEIEPDKVSVWSLVKQVSGVHGFTTRYRGQPEESQSHIRHDLLKKCKGTIEADRTSSSFEQVCL